MLQFPHLYNKANNPWFLMIMRIHVFWSPHSLPDAQKKMLSKCKCPVGNIGHRWQGWAWLSMVQIKKPFSWKIRGEAFWNQTHQPLLYMPWLSVAISVYCFCFATVHPGFLVCHPIGAPFLNTSSQGSPWTPIVQQLKDSFLVHQGPQKTYSMVLVFWLVSVAHSQLLCRQVVE